MADIKEKYWCSRKYMFLSKNREYIILFALSNSHQAKNSLEFRSLFSDRGKEGLQTEPFQYQDLKHNSQSSTLLMLAPTFPNW